MQRTAATVPGLHIAQRELRLSHGTEAAHVFLCHQHRFIIIAERPRGSTTSTIDSDQHSCCFILSLFFNPAILRLVFDNL